jgi:hypothetical protein
VVCCGGLFMAATTVSMLSCSYWFMCAGVWRSQGDARVQSCKCCGGFGTTWGIVCCFLECLRSIWRSLSCTRPLLVAELLLFCERRLMIVRTPVEHVWCHSTPACWLGFLGTLRVFVRSPLTAVGSWLLVSACGGNPDVFVGSGLWLLSFLQVFAWFLSCLCWIRIHLPPWPLGVMFRRSWC